MNLTAHIEAATTFIQKHFGKETPDVGVILGSGLSGFSENLKDPKEIRFSDIPHYVAPSVQGHKGTLSIGKLKKNRVLVWGGRLHPYEGHPADRLSLPMRVMKHWGIQTVVLTNAAGGINLKFKPGDIMVLENHMNFMGFNPLVGQNLETFGPRFPDCSFPFDGTLIKRIEQVAKKLKLKLKKGTYIGVMGPNYETAAEIKAFRKLGADAVGMSTVPEVILARHQNMRVLGLSFISNKAAGIEKKPLSHADVLATQTKAQEKMFELLKTFLSEDL